MSQAPTIQLVLKIKFFRTFFGKISGQFMTRLALNLEQTLKIMDILGHFCDFQIFR